MDGIFGSRRGHASRLLACVIAAAMIFALGNVSALAVHQLAFELDGNIVRDGASTFDWKDFINGSGIPSPVLPAASRPGFVGSSFTADHVLADKTTYTTGSKDTLNISGGWQCAKSNNVNDKVDILNAYSLAFRDPNPSSATYNHLILYFGLEKSSPNGDSNIGVWFLRDGAVKCQSNGGAVDFTGNHMDGDLLLVSSFTNGGGTATVQAFAWVGGADGHLNTSPLGTGGKCGSSSGDVMCATVNASPVVTDWPAPDKDGGSLNALEFFEGGVDLTALHAERCFGRFLADTRSSQSPTATIFDYASGSLGVCGTLTVHKFVDTDQDGVNDAGEPNGAGWSFVVKGPATTTGDGPVVCRGVTSDPSGTLACSAGDYGLRDLPPGVYTVTENQKAAYFNTLPGSGSATDPANTASAVTARVMLPATDLTVEFGNACYIAKTFTVTGVPAGTTGMFVDYSVTAGHNAGQTGTRALVLTGDAASVTISNFFVGSDSLTWRWGINNDHTHVVTGATNESLAAGRSTCSLANSSAYPKATLNGTKYKDVDANGSRGTGDLDGNGFRFELVQGTSVVQTATSAAGRYSFTNVLPGTYTVREVQEAGWVQTEPGPSSPTYTVTYNLGDAAAITIPPFGNTPLSDITVTFANRAVNPGTTTPATAATITCPSTGGSQAGNTFTTPNHVKVGTYTCTVVITDP